MSKKISKVCKKIRLFFTILAIFSPVLSFAATQDDAHIQSVVKRFEPIIQKTLDTWRAPGAAVAIVKDGEIILLKGYGVRVVGKPERVDTHTVFRSVSKGFAAEAAALLAHEKTLTLQDPLVKYVPDFSLISSVQTHELTLQDVLSQSSGLPAHAYDDLLESNVAYPDIVERLKSVNLVCQVGKCYTYQNVMYSMIGDAMTAATGKSYKNIIEERLLKPLDMNDASVGMQSMLTTSNVAMPHIRTRKGWAPVKIKDSYYKVLPAAGVNASISDMAQWLRAQMGYRTDILPQAVLNEVHAPVIRSPEEATGAPWRRERLKSAHYGLGWRVFTYAGRPLVYHAGGVQGYRSEVAYLPEEKVGIVVLSNSDARMSGIIVPTFLDTYLGLPDRQWLQVAKGKK